MTAITITASSVAVGDANPQRYWALSDIRRLSFDRDSELVYNPLTGARHFMPSSAARLLEACDADATLEEHVQRLCHRFQVPASEVAGLTNNLRLFAKKGLLLSRESLLSEYFGTDASSDCHGNASISAIGVPTCNRPDNLNSCLTSFAQCIHQYEREMQFVVADDSQDESVCSANLDVVHAVKRQFGVEILYIGKAEKEAFAAALAEESGVPREIVDFAILNPENCPVGTGANRNALLLSTVGRLFVHADDDTVCRAAAAPDSRSQLALTSQTVPTQTWFSDVLTASDDWPIVDVFSMHERLLGKSVTACVRANDGDLLMDQASGAFFRRLKQSGGKVLVTALGSAGDSGVSWSNQFLQYEGVTRERLMQSQECYRRAVLSHRQVRSVTNVTIGDAPYCLAINIGLDNRAELPPFLPVQRNSDGIFARLLSATIHDAFFGFLPWTIVHDKPQPAPREMDRGRVRVSDLCYMLLQSAASTGGFAGDYGASLSSLGQSLMRIGSLPISEFEELVMLIFWNMHRSRIQMLSALLEKYQGQPLYWANDVAAHIEELRAALAHPHYPLASDLLACFGEEKARTMAPRLVYRFGELLNNWSLIRQAAAKINQLGWQGETVQ